ncbi:response regulator transcription factor [Gulosibacter sp. 10]|uniref:response regulator n=1 Tax=Gulosibacter sp. 10 TaxID=1255570 RepID=UPI00097E9D86|nr:response regulator transcription factor [Gulosibacter sp. 10]SJM53716.1 Two-component system regulatory protein [Gulosibacter sp. 10]
MTGSGIRVLVVDDQTLVRRGIGTLLELGGIDVVGEAADGADALEAIRRDSPDVVLLDLRMPRYDGLWLLERLAEPRSAAPDADDPEAEPPPVLVLTTFDDDALLLEALRLGARGYLLKDVTVERLAAAVATLAEGGTLIAPSITDRLLRAIRSGPPPAGADDAPVQPLTGRELEVLRLVAEGYTNRQIAEIVHLAEGTVKNHLSVILAKLGARDRTNAVLRALHEGILG